MHKLAGNVFLWFGIIAVAFSAVYFVKAVI